MYKKDFLPFEESKAFARSLQLNSHRGWKVYRKSGKKPDNIPASPGITYKNKGWTTWGDFLGTGRIDKKKKVFIPFHQARAFVRSLQQVIGGCIG